MLSSLLAKHRSAREYIEDNAFNILEKAIKPESKSPDRSSRNLCVMLSVIAHHVVEKLSRIGCSAKIISCIGEECVSTRNGGAAKSRLCHTTRLNLLPPSLCTIPG